jgi:hypothetical protein
MPLLSTARRTTLETVEPERAERSIRGEEQLLSGYAWSASLEIVEHSITGILRERKPGLSSALAANGECRVLPINVVKAKCKNIARPQAKAGQ